MRIDDDGGDETAGEVAPEPAVSVPPAPVPPAPVLRVVRGDPAPDELAALLAVLATRSGPAGAPAGPRPRSWAAYWRGHRQPLRPDPDGWRASSRPR